jgi:hypothetical protein
VSSTRGAIVTGADKGSHCSSPPARAVGDRIKESIRDHRRFSGILGIVAVGLADTAEMTPDPVVPARGQFLIRPVPTGLVKRTGSGIIADMGTPSLTRP